ncbi:hypothetical protein RFI_16011 [Reticulomyxa filosa]|uniref:Uncharacterized protein n=1 Tax=Reticulomyxa filosa TaxID=46433 RepID=X6N5H6_RETFI|nr:hypothetical protein RFI_16011 [Reticulomyxa filosa]|eukprot:ETO21193.1 hypothetical protein RFI_16011 [Reticulomyxa filosa]
MNTDNNKFRLSVYAKKPVNRKRRLNDDNENSDFNKQSNIQPNYKRQKVGLNIPLLEKIPENERNENEVKNELNDEKKNDEINEENVWKKSRKIRRQYLYYPINAHTHSASWRTLYVHLEANSKIYELEEISKTLNEIHCKNPNKNNANDCSDNIDPQILLPKCSIFQKTYVEDTKRKRIEELNDPEMNRYMLLKNINIRESEQEIIDTLAEYKYSVNEIQRFNGLPVAKVLMSTAEDVRRILKDDNIFIGYRKKPICKYCGRINHTSEQCKFKKSPTKYQCVLCKGNHRSDSLICPKTQDVRQKLGIGVGNHYNNDNQSTTATKSYNKQPQSNIGHESDDISSLRTEVESLKITIARLNSFMEKVMPLLDSGWNNGVKNASNNISSNSNETTDDNIKEL